MRIYFETMTIPKKAAKRVKQYFSPKDSPLSALPLSQAQWITALMLGYDSWHELEQVTKAKSHPSSPPDEECDPATQRQRLDYQSEQLAYISPLIEVVRRQLAINLRVSARNPLTASLEEQNHHLNRFLYWIDPENGDAEWRFFPSERSSSAYQAIWDDYLFFWKQGRDTFGEYNQRLIAKLKERPEDAYVIEEMLRVALEIEVLDFVEPRLDAFEQVFLAAIPESFPSMGGVFFRWGTVPNRTLHRSTYWLAECFYRLGNFPKAKQWFEFTARTSKSMRPDCIPFLRDLKKESPTGLIHEMDDEDRWMV